MSNGSQTWPSTWRVAQKPYSCGFCSKDIPEGKRYYRAGADGAFCDESCYGQHEWQTPLRAERDKKRRRELTSYDPANTLRGGRA